MLICTLLKNRSIKSRRIDVMTPLQTPLSATSKTRKPQASDVVGSRFRQRPGYQLSAPMDEESSAEALVHLCV
jgi:hypothetical protein